MPRELSRGWKWALGELLIVVVGVLIALGVDSWRQSVAVDRTEAQYLESLLQDLEGDFAELDEAGRQATGNEQWARVVLDVLKGGAEGITPDSLAYAVEYAGFLRFPAYFPYTFDDLVSTGNLRIISDPSIRRAVASYYNLIESEVQWWDRYRGIQSVYTQLVQGTLGPDIRARIMTTSRAAPIEASTEDRRRILRELEARPGLPAALEGMIWVHGRQLRWHAANRLAGERLRDILTEELGRLTAH